MAEEIRTTTVPRCGFAFQIAACIGCLVVYITQAITLDYYIAHHLGATWWCWVIADAIICGLFVIALVVSHRYFKGLSNPEAPQKQPRGGELPLGYITWLAYSLVLGVKIIFLFGFPFEIAQRLKESLFFGPNTLRTTIALSAVVFFLFIETHNDAPVDSTRRGYINAVTSSGSLDMLDTVQLLEILFVQDSHILLSFDMHRAIIAIAFINVVLPTILLLMFSRTQYGKGTMPAKLKLFHKVVYQCLVNIPMFTIRMMLWHVKNANISVFLIKNVMSIGFAFRDILYTYVTLSPDKPGGAEAPTEDIEMRRLEAHSPETGGKPHHPGVSAEI